jgi:peptidoglycan hydrolase-like protein with peptidoglycan-binding domain
MGRMQGCRTDATPNAMDGTTTRNHRTRLLAALTLALCVGGPLSAAQAQVEAPGTDAPPPAQAPAPAGAELGDRLPLRRGMAGDDVAALQRLLTRAGQSAAADGDFGPGTFRALSAWESAAGRRSDGILKAGDLVLLRRAAAAGPPPSEPPPAPPATATITAAGKAVAPEGAPAAVVAIIAAGNRIARKPYRYGGGHPSFTDSAYDCSGSVSFALHGAELLDYPYNSTMLETWGEAGPGTWVTIYANAGHTFMVVAGLRYDTSGQRQAGTRWQPVATRGYDGFVVRHPAGL